MKKVWILLSLVFIFGGSVSAQLPIILESELKRLQAEAATGKSETQNSFRKRAQRTVTEDEQQPVEEMGAATSETVKPKTNNAAKASVKANTQTTSNAAEDNSGSDAMKKFRDRQRRLKNSR